MKITYDETNLDDHKVRKAEVDEVLRSDITIERELVPSRRGNERIMLVGFTVLARLLEIGIEFYQDEDRMHIFHANDATKPYRKEFESEVRQ